MHAGSLATSIKICLFPAVSSAKWPSASPEYVAKAGFVNCNHMCQFYTRTFRKFSGNRAVGVVAALLPWPSAGEDSASHINLAKALDFCGRTLSHDDRNRADPRATSAAHCRDRGDRSAGSRLAGGPGTEPPAADGARLSLAFRRRDD